MKYTGILREDNEAHSFSGNRLYPSQEAYAEFLKKENRTGFHVVTDNDVNLGSGLCNGIYISLATKLGDVTLEDGSRVIADIICTNGRYEVLGIESAPSPAHDPAPTHPSPPSPV